MIWVKRILGVLLVLIGLVWIGQGLGFLPGSMMTGHPIYAGLGLIVGAVGVWLLVTARGKAAVR
jgi:hypothetical protein